MDDIKLIFSRYADTNLTYSNFTDMLLPSDEYYCRILIGKRLTYNVQSINYFEHETRLAFAAFWEAVARSESKAESIKHKLMARPGF